MTLPAKFYIGIDPGIHGAVGVIDFEGMFVSVCSAPVITKKIDGRNKTRCSEFEMKKLFSGFNRDDVLCCIEKAWPRPTDGTSSAFCFGEGYGLWRGLLHGMGFRCVFVAPQKWKRAILGDGTHEKLDSITLAAMKWPEANIRFKKQDGWAEALLIAEYFRSGKDTKYHKEGDAIVNILRERRGF